MPRGLAVWVLGLLAGAPVSGQGGRLAQWEGLRQRKAQQIRPPVRTGLEKALYEIKEQHVIERLMAGWHGFHPTFGGLHTGSGFALGTEWRQERLSGGIFDVRVAGRLSFKAYERFEFQIGAPRLWNEHLFLDFTTAYRNYPQEDYFGLGPDSLRKDRTNFRLEDASYLGAMGLRGWRKRLSVGVRGGLIAVNVGRGADHRFATTESVFNPANTPGLDYQPDYYQFGGFAQLDWRDEAGNPRSGGNYAAQWNTYGDRTWGRYSFRRYDVELQQYVPFFNRRRVIAFRAKTSLSDTSPGHEVPFYLMPTLGGSEDLRGYREFRFRDRNLMVYNLEYRWEVFSGLDMAVFGDAGKVFSRRSDFSLEDLEGAYGIGFRFNQAKSVFLRIDVGRSHEGTRFFFKFGHVF
jgi:outer membrane protein assembly factor BamA